MVVFYRVLLCLIHILVLGSCGVSETKISNIYDYMAVDKKNIKCPEARFISGIDKLRVLDKDKKFLYNITFHKVNWECYIDKNDNDSFYLIELRINFNISYGDDERINTDEENFEYVVAIIDRNKQIIEKAKYTFSFENQGDLLSLNKKNEDTIKFEISTKFVKKFSELKLLLGFVLPK